MRAQRWRKLGHVFSPDGEGWLSGYAAVPFLDWVDDDVARVYFSSRDAAKPSTPS